MDFIITFFSSIDGWVYYTMLVVNTILIFAIIGYLGEKNNEQLMKLGMNTSNPSANNGAMNLTPVHTPSSHNEAIIPKVAATKVNNAPNTSVVQGGQVVGQVVTNKSGTSNNPVVNDTPTVNQNPQVNAPSNIPFVNQDPIPGVKPGDNQTSSNQKAPAVLIINSSDSKKDVK